MTDNNADFMKSNIFEVGYQISIGYACRGIRVLRTDKLINKLSGLPTSITPAKY